MIMQEKVLKGKPGMPVLLGGIVLYLLALVMTIYGGMLLEAGKTIGALPLALGILWLMVGFFPFLGLKVVKPQEALVLTLFGKYTGTLKSEGFFFVHPFSVAINPAAKTRLGQSGDVDSGSRSKVVFSSAEGSARMEAGGSKKISLKVMTLNNSKQKVNDTLGNPVDIGIAVMWWIPSRRFSMWTISKSIYRCSVTVRCATLCASIPTMSRPMWIPPATAGPTRAACAAPALR
jgi:hypothetical protein